MNLDSNKCENSRTSWLNEYQEPVVIEQVLQATPIIPPLKQCSVVGISYIDYGILFYATLEALN